MLCRFYNSSNLHILGRRSLCKDIRLKGLFGFFWDINKRNMCEDSKANTWILFCGPHFAASHNYTKEYLQNYPSIQVDDLPFATIPDLIGNYDMCVVKGMRLNSDVIARATRMKLIMQYGVGLEGQTREEATWEDADTIKGQFPDASLEDKTLLDGGSNDTDPSELIQSLPKPKNEMQIAVRQKKPGEPIGDTLLGKTVFIMGFGNIGIELAKRLRPFGVRILATKRNWASSGFNSTEPTSQNGAHEDLVDEKGSHEDIYEFAKISDIVVCCLTMNNETAGIINKNFVSSMRKGGLLVNIARGGLLDYDAVYNSLKSGHLGGLGIDVAWAEPFDPDDPILKFPNVLLTPHVAGVTECSYRFMAQVVGDVAIQLQSGKPFTGIELVN